MLVRFSTICRVIIVLTPEYTACYDNTHVITMPCQSESVTNIDLTFETPIPLDPNPNNLSGPLDGPASDNEVMSNEDSVTSSCHNEDMDSGSELDDVFGLIEKSDPFLEVEYATFLDTYASSELSGVLSLT
jgi:hypothetical protein